jgi:hypothetical protein
LGVKEDVVEVVPAGQGLIVPLQHCDSVVCQLTVVIV